MLRWNVEVEHVDVRLGHHVEYTGSMSRLPILVPECSKGSHLEGGVIDEFCLPVKLSTHRSLFAALLNLATSRPGHRVFAMLAHSARGPGE